jgi:hypothetical protein
MRSADEIGDCGESIFRVRITQPCGTQPAALFRAICLGEKKATIDFMVELVGLPNRVPYCFIQVKATAKGVSPSSNILKVSVKKRDIDRMVSYPCPTYIAGIDEKNEKAYIISANETVAKDLATIPIRYPLDAANLAKLWAEVDGYWRKRNMTLKKSVFSA